MFSGNQGLGDFEEDAVEIVEDGVVGEAHHTVSVRFQICSALPVVLLSAYMSSSIQFYNQLSFCTKKIGYKWSERDLSAEFEAAELAIPEVLPQMFFCSCLAPAQ